MAVADRHGLLIVRNRKNAPIQDGHALRLYQRRWKVEKPFAWFHNFRRILTRWAYRLEIQHGFVHLVCQMNLLKHF